MRVSFANAGRDGAGVMHFTSACASGLCPVVDARPGG